MPKPIDVVEALLFASDVPLEAERIREVLDLEGVAAARELVGELAARYEAEERGLAIMEVGGGWRACARACGSRGRRWRRSPSSPTSSRCHARRSTPCAA